ncbi:MAG TPA: tripartite tricarboxylate transporter TctB family protein [Pseudonocardiaceae bacterium]|nr:tripartite tricarboxylate transporter TctB family protein [Pseudonocardiaceae bacterium]
MSDAPTTDPTNARATRSKGELVFDIVIVLAIGGYLLVAQSYPPIGRQIPTVVGIVALVAAVVQLIGWFVPGMWKFSHGDPAADSRRGSSAQRATSEATRQTSVTSEEETAAPEVDGKPIDVPIAMAWAGGFLGAILLVGYVIAVPLFFLVYFGVRRSWVLAVVSAVVMGVVTSVLFEQALDIPLYGGILF